MSQSRSQIKSLRMAQSGGTKRQAVKKPGNEINILKLLEGCVQSLTSAFVKPKRKRRTSAIRKSTALRTTMQDFSPSQDFSPPGSISRYSENNIELSAESRTEDHSAAQSNLNNSVEILDSDRERSEESRHESAALHDDQSQSRILQSSHRSDQSDSSQPCQFCEESELQRSQSSVTNYGYVNFSTDPEVQLAPTDGSESAPADSEMNFRSESYGFSSHLVSAAVYEISLEPRNNTSSYQDSRHQIAAPLMNSRYEQSDIAQYAHAPERVPYTMDRTSEYTAVKAELELQTHRHGTTDGSLPKSYADSTILRDSDADFDPDFNRYNERSEVSTLQGLYQNDDQWEAQPYEPEERDFGVGLPPTA